MGKKSLLTDAVTDRPGHGSALVVGVILASPLVVGTAAAQTAPEGAAPILALLLVPLQLCAMPIVGDILGWGLPVLRQAMIVGGIFAAGYGLVFAPVDGKVDPRTLFFGGLIIFGIGLAWVSVIVYVGTDVFGGEQALINTATCGMTGSGS